MTQVSCAAFVKDILVRHAVIVWRKVMIQLMKAAVVHEFGAPLRIEEVPVPKPGRGQILVNIKASAVCHTDLHTADGDWQVKPTLPFIPGHEGVGYVAGVGEGVTHVKEGDRVGVPWLYTACGHCEHCLGGWETLCHEQQNTGYSVNGAYAEYVLADPGLCRPSAVDGRVRRYRPDPPGQWIAISGIGGPGPRRSSIRYCDGPARGGGRHIRR